MFSLLSPCLPPINWPRFLPAWCHGRAIPFRHAVARGSAARDRSHRRARTPPVDGPRRDHRPLDRREAHAGNRLRVPAGARSRHDAPARRPPQRHPAARHRREHLARHHRDLHLCADAVLRACRSLDGRRPYARQRTVPFVAHVGAAAVVAAVSESKGDLGLVPAAVVAGGSAWWNALEFDAAPKIIARLPFVDRADHPAAMPVFVISRAAADAMVTEVEVWSVRVAGWSARAANTLGAAA